MQTIKLVGCKVANDNGDGSSTITFYPSREAALKDFREYKSEDEVSDEDFFHNDDPYENGYFDDHVTLTIELDDDGKLLKPFSLSTD